MLKREENAGCHWGYWAPQWSLPALGCLRAKKRKGRSRWLYTPYSLVGRQPIEARG